MEQFRQTCREHGLKITPQRVLIYRELARSKDHPSPEVLYERVRSRAPEVSFDTVYRSLSTFREIGVADLVDGYGTAMRFDPTTTNHHHFRCVRCETILDFDDETYDALPVPGSIGRRCDVQKIRVTIEGLCAKCRAKSASRPKRRSTS